MENPDPCCPGSLLADVSSRDKIRVTGKDRVTVLHRLLTQDIRALAAGQGAPAALLNARGKVLAWMNVFSSGEFLLLDLDEGCGASASSALERLIITEDAVLTAEKGFGHFILAGSNAAEILNQCGFPKPAEPQAWKFFFESFSFEGKQGLIAQTRAGLFEIMIPHETAPDFRDTLLKTGKNAGLQEVSPEAWESFRIEHGILKFGTDVTLEETLPETDLDTLLASETKGCYPGQEVVARTNTYKGHAKKMRGIVLETSSIPSPGSVILEGEEEIGRVTSACFSARRNSAVCLAYLKRGHFDEGLKRVFKIGGGTFQADVLNLSAFRSQA